MEGKTPSESNNSRVNPLAMGVSWTKLHSQTLGLQNIVAVAKLPFENVRCLCQLSKNGKG